MEFFNPLELVIEDTARLSRRHFVKISLVGLSEGLSGCAQQKDKISFHEARYNPSLREQHVLQAAQSIGIPDYIDFVGYVPPDKAADFDRNITTPINFIGENMVTVPKGGRIDPRRKGSHTLVGVRPRSYDGPDINSDLEFRLTMKHEFTHSRLYYELTDRLGFPPNYFFTSSNGSLTFHNSLHFVVNELESYSTVIFDSEYSSTTMRFKNHITIKFAERYIYLWESTPVSKDIIDQIKNSYRAAAENLHLVHQRKGMQTNKVEYYLIANRQEFVLPERR